MCIYFVQKSVSVIASKLFLAVELHFISKNSCKSSERIPLFTRKGFHVIFNSEVSVAQIWEIAFKFSFYKLQVTLHLDFKLALKFNLVFLESNTYLVLERKLLYIFFLNSTTLSPSLGTKASMASLSLIQLIFLHY